MHFHQLVLCLFSLLVLLPSFISALPTCGGPCKNLNDCKGQLICTNGKCNDDPDVGTHICGGKSPPPSAGDTCEPSGVLTCKGGKSKPTYTCSPPVTASTPANSPITISAKGGGGDPSECDGCYHSNKESIVALSTGWYGCGKMIKITAKNGKTTKAKVVDECDSRHDCDKEHDYQVPCDNNVVDASNAVWKALGLNTDVGVVDVTWSMA